MENKIIRHIKNNNNKGLDLLVDNYSRNIYILVKSILRDYASEDDIEEYVSDILIDIYRDIDSFNKEKLSFNKFILLKSKKKALDYKLKYMEHKNEESDKNTIDIEDIIVDETVDEYDTKEVLNIIKSFKQPDKTYFYLIYFRGYDIKTVAQKFGDSENLVQNIIIKCKFKLKNILCKGAKMSGR